MTAEPGGFRSRFAHASAMASNMPWFIESIALGISAVSGFCAGGPFLHVVFVNALMALSFTFWAQAARFLLPKQLRPGVIQAMHSPLMFALEAALAAIYLHLALSLSEQRGPEIPE